jgi:hypothetical protein
MNTLFNNFLNTVHRLLYTSFSTKRTKIKQSSKDWQTTGIKTSCSNKIKLYLLCRESSRFQKCLKK